MHVNFSWFITAKKYTFWRQENIFTPGEKNPINSILHTNQCVIIYQFSLIDLNYLDFYKAFDYVVK